MDLFAFLDFVNLPKHFDASNINSCFTLFNRASNVQIMFKKYFLFIISKNSSNSSNKRRDFISDHLKLWSTVRQKFLIAKTVFERLLTFMKVRNHPTNPHHQQQQQPSPFVCRVNKLIIKINSICPEDYAAISAFPSACTWVVAALYFSGSCNGW